MEHATCRDILLRCDGGVVFSLFCLAVVEDWEHRWVGEEQEVWSFADYGAILLVEFVVDMVLARGEEGVDIWQGRNTEEDGSGKGGERMEDERVDSCVEKIEGGKYEEDEDGVNVGKEGGEEGARWGRKCGRCLKAGVRCCRVESWGGGEYRGEEVDVGGDGEGARGYRKENCGCLSYGYGACYCHDVDLSEHAGKLNELQCTR